MGIVQPLPCRLGSSSLAAERLKLAMRASRVAMWELDVSAQRVYLSPEWQEMLGGEPVESVASIAELFDLVPAEEREGLLAASANAARGLVDEYTVAHRVRRKDGEWLWIQSRGKVVERDGSGRALRLIGTNADITERKRDEQALRESEEKLRLFVDYAPSAIAMFDHEMRYLGYSRRWVTDYDLGEQELLGRSHYEIFPDLPERWRDIHRRCLAGAVEKAEDEPLPRADGTVDWVRWEVHPWHHADGEIGGILMFSEVTTSRKRTTALLEGKKRVLEMISRGQPLGETLDALVRVLEEQSSELLGSILVLDADGRHVRHVAAPNLPLAYCQAVDGSAIGERAGSCGTAMFLGRPVIVEDIASDPLWAEYRHLAAAHGLRACWSAPIFDPQQRVLGALALYCRSPRAPTPEQLSLIGRATDIAGIAIMREREAQAREQHAARIERIAFFDELTGLPNANRFLRTLAKAAGSGKPLAVLLLSLPQFARLNESLGRSEADNLLRIVARRLEQGLADALEVARLDGGRFAALLPARVAPEEALRGRLKAIFRDPVALAGMEFAVEFKAGVVLCPLHGTNPGELMQQAVSALEEAKRSGEPVCMYGPELLAAARERLRLESELRAATLRGEFELHYQPRIDTETGAIAGLEALLRWRHPERGLVPPKIFVPVLEDSGLIVAAGQSVMLAAARQGARWREAAICAPRIAVNVSARQLRQRDFVDTVRAILAETGAPGLDLEITESLIMEDVEYTITQLRALRETGVRIAVDDFGTGYSSLAYLAKLPLDALKIDRAFVSDISNRADHEAIARSIISLAHALDLKVCAEGVETEAQRALLASLRCNEMQGYLFARPMPADEVEKLLRAASGPQPVREARQ